MRSSASIAFLAAVVLPRCGCSDTGTGGHADAADEDTAFDPWIVDGPCTGCNDGNPCTMDLCNL